SARAAGCMRDRGPGLEVPEPVVRRMEQAGDQRARREDEWIRICVEVIERVREIPGIAGFHLMPIHWEEAVAEISARAGLHPALGPPATAEIPAGPSAPARHDHREHIA